MNPLFPDVLWHDVEKTLQQARVIHIIAHVCPDTDTLGSQIALYYCLKSLDYSVYMHNMDAIPRICAYLEGSELISHGADIPKHVQDADVVVAVDAGAASRLGIDKAYFSNKTLINIDHHASNVGYGDINIVDARYCATGAMIYDFSQYLNIAMPKASAAAIYAAVLTDTASFRLSTMTAAAHHMIAHLIDAGADVGQASRCIYQSHSQQRFVLLKDALESLTVADQGRSAYMCVEYDSYIQTSTQADDTEGFIDYPRNIEGVKIAVFIRAEGQDGWKVSMRGEAPYRVDHIAKSFGGGGHQYAAAYAKSGDLKSVLSQIKHAVSHAFQS